MTGELDRIAALVEDSRLWQAIVRPVTVAPAAWQSSRTGQAFRSSTARWSSSPAPQRVRFSALTIGVAAAVHAAILQVLPQYARPGIPLRWLAFVIGGAMLTAVCAEAIAAAWPGSTMAAVIVRIRAIAQSRKP
jgi:hypothetical protein